jgi:hypothetical protein
VQAELGRHRLAGFHAAHRVAALVEPRRKHADAQLPRQHGHDAATDTALGRQADTVDPLAGEVVDAAGRHHRQHLRHGRRCQRAFAADGVHAAVGERGGHQRQIAAAHQHRALAEVELRRRLGVALQDAGVAQQVADGAVAVAGVALACEHRIVHHQRPAGASRKRAEQAFEPGVSGVARNQRGHRDGAGVDHRVQRPPGAGLQADRIEGFAGRLDAHSPRHALGAAGFERQAVYEWFGNRLDGERQPRIARLVDLAADRGDDDAEGIGRDLRELGNVGGTAPSVWPTRRSSRACRKDWIG